MSQYQKYEKVIWRTHKFSTRPIKTFSSNPVTCHVQWFISTGRLKVQGNSKAVANFERPNCSVCEFGKGYCQSNKVNTINNNTMKEQYIKKDNILTGHMVSADHYILRAPGRIYHTKGKSDPYDMFSGGFFY